MKYFALPILVCGLACLSVACSDGGSRPNVESVHPDVLCGSGGRITVNGSGFNNESVVSINLENEEATEIETSYVDGETLTATVPVPTPDGIYDVTVENPAGSDTLEAALTVYSYPDLMVYFVDPYTLYNGVNLQVTIYGPGSAGTVTEVVIFPTDQPGDAIPLDFTQDASGRLQAVVPAGLSAGTYDVSVTADSGCSGMLEGAFEIVADLTVAIDSIELPFGWTDESTGVNIYSPENPGEGMENFAATPRFYLNPIDAGTDTVASELVHTAFVSPTRASSVVPSGLPVGMYDLIAVNPSGAIGLLENAFEVTALPPPEIEALLPPSVINQATQQITIIGRNFRTPEFEADCLEPDGDMVPLVGTILTSDATSIDVEFDFVTQIILDGTICVVKVTNDDGTYATFSALSVTNPSLNLENFTTASAMNTARRAPCAVAGSAAPGARFLYAIGGDNGNSQDTDASTVYDTVEMVAVDPYGNLGDWTELPYRLPAPRSFHACTGIARYVYVMGGSEAGAGAASTVWRAKILDPEEAPEIDLVTLSVDPEQAALFTPGRYVYRVAAVFPSDDPINPGGESLAGNPTLVQIPDIAERLSVSISWTAVAEASMYRVYRTPEPGQAAYSERLLAELDGSLLTYTDDGGTIPSGAQPLPFGAMGQFAVQPSMNTAREGAGIAVATDPGTADVRIIYLLGGRDDSNNGLDSIEWLDIQVQSDGTQTVGSAWTDGSASIGEPRWQLAAWVADDQSAPDVVPAGEVWVYAGGGIRDDQQFMVPDVVALRVASGGALGESAANRHVVDEMQPFKAGYAAGIFTNQLFAFGGTQGSPNTECNSIEMCGLVAGQCSTSIPDPPDLANWNSLGIDLTVARYLSAGAMVSPFVFIVGGVDNSSPNAPLSAVDKTFW